MSEQLLAVAYAEAYPIIEAHEAISRAAETEDSRSRRRKGQAMRTNYASPIGARLLRAGQRGLKRLVSIRQAAHHAP